MSVMADTATVARAATDDSRLDVGRLREDFPILGRHVYGKPLVFLDSAASAQKPRAVIDAMRSCYENDYANIHRGVYYLSQRATEAYEAAREKVRHFVNARDSKEIVFVRNATEAINLVANSYGRKHLQAGDEVVLTEMEHHANIVPWQMLREKKGIVLRVVPINDEGELRLDAFEEILGPHTKFVAVGHVSNALGTINPVKEIVALARARGVPVLLDGAQAAPHLTIDVQDIDCDFYAFTGHKLYGPSGIGVLYGKAAHLEAMPPYQGGGEMILSVTFEDTLYKDTPFKFEAGTPNIVGAVGLGAAIDYLSEFGIEKIAVHEHELAATAADILSAIDGLRLVGTAKDKAAIVSFTLDGVHPHDIGTILDRQGIAVRAGHHCAQPVMARFGIAATVRASFGAYNTVDEVDVLARCLRSVQEIFG